MGYVPKDAKWYLAELVIEIRITRSRKNVVHRNLTLVRANSPDEAFEKANQFGLSSETSYENPNGRLVRHIYRGISRLEVAVWGLADGAELTFLEDVGVSAKALANMIPDREQLEVFRPPRVRADSETNYAASEILKPITLRKNAPKAKKRAKRLPKSN